MLNQQDNTDLTRVGPGTLMGDLFRRFWLPALLSSEIREKEGAPVRLRILGEDLIAFRNSSGKVGVISAYCSHRRAPLFFGRNEDDGFRCPYHGWKFGLDGKCLEVPNGGAERDLTAFKERAAIDAYPALERGGLVWVYMGPGDKAPDLPDFEWLRLPQDHLHLSRWIQASNYMQGVEGEIDSSHISYLHKEFADDGSNVSVRMAGNDGAPEVVLKETPYGFLSGARRTSGDQYYWRVSQWLLPTYSFIPRGPEAFTVSGGRVWVPVDDDNVMTFSFTYRVDRPFNAEDIAHIESGKGFPPRLSRATIRLGAGHRIDTFVPVANMDNDYLMDRNLQKVMNFTGIWGANEQDRALQESMPRSSLGQTVDRSKEHLVSTDAAIVAARRRLLRVAREMRSGVNPDPVPDGGQYSVRAISRICNISDFNAFVSEYGDALQAPEVTGSKS